MTSNQNVRDPSVQCTAAYIIDDRDKGREEDKDKGVHKKRRTSKKFKRSKAEQGRRRSELTQK